eukprot:CAMPEP_0197822968 /NCGR_PEP_ID=MMETSP1437-20131217/284_1 /TAXON_ID=49252 ORGANISM="Eucampia antarctica, Strain CCMP1452" /NCGR_SAMPLE_ID=MMETSP1437 /ASSEMBLY_ACC=CAM_ASM_001096 /LENGTH=428 /DNA_ID=CAMNT_0043421881 /DNA_START=169 /DNA_END=1452 /DNA_ORIENTATION=-
MISTKSRKETKMHGRHQNTIDSGTLIGEHPKEEHQTNNKTAASEIRNRLNQRPFQQDEEKNNPKQYLHDASGGRGYSSRMLTTVQRRCLPPLSKIVLLSTTFSLVAFFLLSYCPPTDPRGSFDNNEPPPPPSTTSQFNFVPFNSYPSIGSMCHLPEFHQDVLPYCNNKTGIGQGRECLEHEKMVDDKLLQYMNIDHPLPPEDCKMLWFAAMHESSCENPNHHFYPQDYSVALNSALVNAGDILQPVLILSRYGLPNENSTKSNKLGIWAEEKGVKVIYPSQLSFQEDLPKTWPPNQSGPFLRIDIPKFVKEHNLFDMPNVCQDHVLYTDVDIVFPNKMTQKDVQILLQSVGTGIASYGREYGKSPHIQNTGVMVMHVKRFEQELPLILQTAREQDSYPGHDQYMLNIYKDTNEINRGKFQLLPIHYNW